MVSSLTPSRPSRRDCPDRPELPDRRRRQLAALALAAALALPFACGREEGPRDLRRVPLMQFRVDAELLGPASVDSTLRFSFRPPRSFVPAESAAHEQIRRHLARERRSGDPLATDPVWLYALPGTAGLCKVGRFVEPPPGGMNRGWIDRCREEMERQVSPAAVQWDLYRLDDRVVAAQFLATNEQMVLFRVLCQGPGPEPVMVDYLLPRDRYASEVRGVESSIGSLQMF